MSRGEALAMIAYLVLARTAPNENPEGDMIVYAASFETENEALEATLSGLPSGGRVEKVIGPASPTLVDALHLKPGMVVSLS